ncbi:dTDP-4-dehydrorhamnose reductase [hydrothermal vent metagenome]|uniref:dTDP-4-dehydrorhamnose reductase n=1 Tax=hydrothermal vent metagenome TaxID=652676 RepID=A0A3B0RGJ0_9ZZZZ
MSRLLVFGRSGQVARALQGLAPEATFLDRAAVDLADPAACAAAIAAHQPQMVINAAAFTAVDRAEEEEVLATKINGDAPGAMAQECARANVPFVHISTDYVFPGDGTAPWQPDDATAPLNAYGRSKLAGENLVRAAHGAHVILRTSWVFSARGQNFVRTMLRLSASHKALRVVDDQIGGPTPAADIAWACLKIARALRADPAKSGTYHYSGASDVSWKGFAQEIFAQSGKDVEVSGIATADYPTPAPRPLNSRLECHATKAAFGLERPDWRAGLARVLAELREL